MLTFITKFHLRSSMSKICKVLKSKVNHISVSRHANFEKVSLKIDYFCKKNSQYLNLKAPSNNVKMQ